MASKAWAVYVKEQRQKAKLTRRELAGRSKIDPSYITLMERDGYIPRVTVVRRLAETLGVARDIALLTAGYAPESRAAFDAAMGVARAESRRKVKS